MLTALPLPGPTMNGMARRAWQLSALMPTPSSRPSKMPTTMVSRIIRIPMSPWPSSMPTIRNITKTSTSSRNRRCRLFLRPLPNRKLSRLAIRPNTIRYRQSSKKPIRPAITTAIPGNSYRPTFPIPSVTNAMLPTTYRSTLKVLARNTSRASWTTPKYSLAS